MPRQVTPPRHAGGSTEHHGNLGADDSDRLPERVCQAVALEQRLALTLDPHDSMMQILFSLHLTARAATESLERDPVRAREALEMVLRLVREARMELHTALFELRENVLAGGGLIAALERYVEMLERHYDLRIVLRLQRGVRLPARYQEGIYLLAREGLLNVIKHARAAQATVILTADDTGIRMCVEDDGIGFGEAEPEWASCGLPLLRERVRALGGDLRLGNSAQGGACLDAKMPLPEES